MKVITKKITQQYFEDVWAEKKQFELRKEDDVTFDEDDLLILLEINGKKEYTGRLVMCRVIYVLRNYEGLEKGYAIIGIQLEDTFKAHWEKESAQNKENTSQTD